MGTKLTHIKPTFYENGLFYVKIVNFKDPVLEEYTDGYGIFNRETNVREAECRRLAYAKNLADRFEEEAAIVDQDGGALAAMPAANQQAV